MISNVGSKLVNSPEEKIVKFLRKKKGFGLSISELSRLTNLSRFVVRMVLAKLEGANSVVVRRVGMAKVYLLKENR